MKLTALALVAAAPLFALLTGCSAAPADEATDSTSEDLGDATIVSRGMEWVNAKLHYCQAAQGAVDYDSACWPHEGSSHRCDRESNAAWNRYRSDCSGFVTFAWGIPPVGDGGYVTSNFAPYSNSFSHTISGVDLRPGDALNKTPDGHIILFKSWLERGRTAVFMEEPGCSSSMPYAHEFTSNVSISGDRVYVAYENETFIAIRYNGSTNQAEQSSSGGNDNASPPGDPTPSDAADACNKPAGFCTPTLQCDDGHWIVRQDDSHACTSVQNVEESCNKGNGYCTHTLQCDNGHWVPRANDPAKCTTGPGVQ
jgi:hypothetical protein